MIFISTGKVVGRVLYFRGTTAYSIADQTAACELDKRKCRYVNLVFL